MSHQFRKPVQKEGERDDYYQLRLELAVMNFIIKTLGKLTPNQRKRAFAFLWDRFVENPDETDAA
jgi:hypothetical protein